MPVTSTIISNTSKYINEGLNILSNHPDVHKRDEAGNIVFKEKDNANLALVIEPVRFNYTVKSTLDVLPTRFTYYEFPVTTLQSSAPLGNLDFNLNADEDIATEVPDSVGNTITGYYTVPPMMDSNGKPDTLRRIGLSYRSYWLNTDERVEALPKAGTNIYAQTVPEYILQFDGDGKGVPHTYNITQDTIDYLTTRNKLLKFTYKITWIGYYSSPSHLNDKTHLPTGFVSKLMKQSNLANGSSYTSVVLRTYNVSIKRASIREDQKESDYAHLIWYEDPYPVLYAEVMIDPTDLQDGDSFFIEVIGGNPCYINTDQTYWKVNAIDTPGENIKPYVPMSRNNQRSGVYVMSEKTAYIPNNGTEYYTSVAGIQSQTLTSGQVTRNVPRTPNTIPFNQIP